MSLWNVWNITFSIQCVNGKSTNPQFYLSLGNILPDSTAAPSLQGQQKELERHMRSDSLEQKLQQRPKPEELIKEGILEADEDPTK